MQPQPGILPGIPPHARYLTFRFVAGVDPRGALRALASRPVDDRVVIGLGASMVRALDATVDGLRAFPGHEGPGVTVPSTPAPLWAWLRGEDRGELLHRGRALEAALAPIFALDEATDAFTYGAGLDLSGYEDGTENPTGDEAIRAAFADDGSSFVAVQRWVHDLARLDAMSELERDHTIGRRHVDNEEIDDAPASAHVKRTAQESFEPEAFLVRRSMPWSDPTGSGLVFVAFGRSFDAFDAILARMVGAEDGVVDALFRFTRPVSGAFFWCPPVRDGRLDLSRLGL